jgi:hypothetical protein
VRTALCCAALAIACGSPPPPAAPPPVEVTPPGPGAQPVAEHPPPAQERPASIEACGVGELRIGKPIPEQLLADDRAARAAYEIRWIADAQPFEAFRIGAVLAAFEGPFTRWAESEVGELEPSRFVEQALRDVRAGAPVRWMVIEAAGPRTAAGIGVDSSFEELSQAYPGAKVDRLPEWFESRPTCQVKLEGELRCISFHLHSCGKQPPGRVVRVLIGQ